MKKYEAVSLEDITIENITKAMLFHAGEPYATSTQIAKYFGVRHDNLLRKIESFHSFDDFIGSSKLRSQIRIIKGKKYPYYELDADAFTFTCLSFTGKKAESFKLSFIQAFKVATAEALTERVKAETNLTNSDYIAIREDGKMDHLSFTDIIKEFCEYAQEQKGSEKSTQCHYFKHFQTMIYKCLGLKVSKAHSSNKDTYTLRELANIKALEKKLADEIIAFMDYGLSYKNIYTFCKAKIEILKEK